MFSTMLHEFEFAHISWLWGLIIVPLVWALYALVYRPNHDTAAKLKDFADPHLLPHLLGEAETQGRKKRSIWVSLSLWSLLWSFGLLAMAGPRWDYMEVKAYTPSRNLVILLDLSRSMDAQDVKPSRLARARQEIEDIDKAAQGMNIGLIAFASVAHVITPLTDERQTLLNFLPSLNTDLVYTQGSALSPALTRAGAMLAAEPSTQKHILVITDGGFQDGDATIYKAEQELIKQGIKINIMGIGTAEGAPVPNGQGGFSKENGKTAITRLEANSLKRIAQDGNGLYLEANYLDHDTQALLSRINSAAQSEASKTTRFWEERFYLLLIPFALILLPWFRRNAAFPSLMVACLLLAQPTAAQAFEWKSLFLNTQQQGAAALEQERYEKAAKTFNTPYNRGVAEYKAGQFEQAAKAFAAANNANTAYNLANAQLMNGKTEEAIAGYESLLKADPKHEDAAHNLEIAKKILEQQQQSQNSDQKDSQKQQSEEEQKDQQSSEQNAQDKQDQQQSEKPSEDQQAQQQPSDSEQQEDSQQKPQQSQKTQQDIDADQWLNRIESDPQQFLKNKFYIESQRQGAEKGENPW